MNDEKKKIIVDEINYWRKNKLLPERYCVFLLNLYTGADASEYANTHSRTQKSFLQNSVIWMITGVFVIVLLYLIFHFNDFTPLMQTGMIVFLFLFTFLFTLISYKKQHSIAVHLTFGLNSVIMILGGSHIIRQFYDDFTIILLFLLLCFVVWMIIGFLFKLRYYIFSGMMGFLLLYGWNIHPKFSTAYVWWMIQLYWLPISVLLIASGYLIINKNAQLGKMIGAVGFAALYGPEMQSLFIAHALKDVILFLLYIKLFISALFLYFTRTKWFSKFHI